MRIPEKEGRTKKRGKKCLLNLVQRAKRMETEKSK
jgi:hypothetical protein